MSLAIAGLLVIMVVSALAAWWQAGRKTAETPVRIMMFVGYFWLFTFIQLLLAVLGYQGWQRFFPH